MFKKAISCFCATVLIIGAVITPLKFSPIFAQTSKPASGDYLLYSFDDVNSLSEQGWEPRNDNEGKALKLSLETDSSNVYGGTGKSLKIEYDTAQKTGAAPPLAVLRYDVITPKGDGITFWLKSDKDTTIGVLAADATQQNIIRIDDVKVKKGENLLSFKYTDFSCTTTPNLSKIYQLQIRATATNEQNILYLDNVGSADKEKIKQLIDDYDKLLVLIEDFYAAFEKQWMWENKPHGFDVQDIRIGGLIMRVRHNRQRLLQFVNGDIDRIEELEEPILDVNCRPENEKGQIYYNMWYKIVTTNVIKL